MICLLLIMTMIFVNGTQSAEQKLRHSETLLKEEDSNAKTKAWLLMVESGKVDQEELRRITPKSIFIAPLLTGRAGKCKEGYRHDHLGQCVKVIKIDPQVQLELLLQKLNKLYGEKQEEKKEEEEKELFEVSSGPLHFSLPISNAGEDVGQTTSDAKSEAPQVSTTTANATASEGQNVSEFIPVPLPAAIHHQNNTNQTKEMESSGAEPPSETETYEASQVEGSGDGQPASGDGLPEEEAATPSQVGFFPEETDYYDATERETTTRTKIHFATTEPPEEDFTATWPSLEESYQNNTDVSTVNNANATAKDSIKENAREEITAEQKSHSERIHFPSDEAEVPRPPTKAPAVSSRIKFPDELPQRQVPGHLAPPDSTAKLTKHQSHSTAIPREQFWWLPKNWRIDENHHKSTLVKVWSRLPLIHDVSYSDGFKKPDEPSSQIFDPRHAEGAFSARPARQQPTSLVPKPFKSSRFQDILITPRQNFRFQR